MPSPEADPKHLPTHVPSNGAPHHEAAHTDDRVRSDFSRGTGLKVGVSAALVAAALIAGFIIVRQVRSHHESELNSQTTADADAPPGVNVVMVKYGSPTQTIVLPGETRAWYESTIYARVSGYLANWTADIGDRVKKGQVLATIETPELDDQLNASRAKLKVSDADVAVMQANTVLAKSNYDRWWESPKGVVSDQEREEKKAEYDSSIAKLNAAKSQVNLDQADVDRLTEMAAFKAVRAPFDGVITARRIDIGDLVTAGSTANTTSLYSIAQADRIRVYVDVPQSASVGMNIGMAAVAVADEYPDRKFTGTIARTSNSIDPAARTLRVEVDIANPNLTLLPGMYLEVTFELKRNSLLQVPASALLFRSSGPQVAVVDDQGKVSFHPVVIAQDQGEVVQIASGLAAKDKVALNISSQITEGERVNAVDTDKPAVAQTAASAPSDTTATVDASR